MNGVGAEDSTDPEVAAAVSAKWDQTEAAAATAATENDCEAVAEFSSFSLIFLLSRLAFFFNFII
jgi:hypothetical protein